MKKKILFGFAVLAIAAVTAFNMGLHSTNGLSDISLANAEALAQSEKGAKGVDCYDVNSFAQYMWTWDCSICDWVNGIDTNNYRLQCSGF